MNLTSDQIRHFHLHGFLSIAEPIASAEELEWLRGLYDEIFAKKAGREIGDQFDLAGVDSDDEEAKLPQILNPGRYSPEMATGKFLGEANAIAQHLMGPEMSVGLAHAIFKPAGVGAATPWHQDEAYWDPQFLHRTISIWMPLQEATVENGCLWFLPGSHQYEILDHQPIGGDVRVHGLEMVSPPDLSKAVACPLPAGGVTIHLGRTAHYAGPNVSGTPRRALIMMGALPGEEYPHPRRFEWLEAQETARLERAGSAGS